MENEELDLSEVDEFTWCMLQKILACASIFVTLQDLHEVIAEGHWLVDWFIFAMRQCDDLCVGPPSRDLVMQWGEVRDGNVVASVSSEMVRELQGREEVEVLVMDFLYSMSVTREELLMMALTRPIDELQDYTFIFSLEGSLFTAE